MITEEQLVEKIKSCTATSSSDVEAIEIGRLFHELSSKEEVKKCWAVLHGCSTKVFFSVHPWIVQLMLWVYITPTMPVAQPDRPTWKQTVEYVLDGAQRAAAERLFLNDLKL